MGPRSIDRGNGWVYLDPERLTARFNGAAIDRSRKSVVSSGSCLRGGGPLQWGRDRSIAEILATRRARAPRRPLQWGRDRSIAEIRMTEMVASGVSELQWGRDRSIAEMRSKGVGRAPACRGFNGAAIDRSRKLGPFAKRCRTMRRFNGAAIDRSRKCRSRTRSRATHRVLQWGRDRSIAEIS